MKIRDIIALAVSLAITQAAGVVGSFFTAPAISNWYVNLTKPEITPPAWVFAPVWVSLFALMGIAAFLVWRRNVSKKEVKIALGTFIVQLALNVFWSVIFFGLRNPGAALIEIIFLWLAIIATIFYFYKISRVASYLLWPYLVWVSFAAYLNYLIYSLN